MPNDSPLPEAYAFVSEEYSAHHPDDPQHGGDEDRVAQAGDRDIEQLFETGSAVDVGGLIQIVRDPLQAGEDHQGKERYPLPDDRDDHGGQRRIGPRKKGDLVPGDVQPHQDIIDHAVVAVEHPAPHQGDQHTRGDPGDQAHRAHHAAALEALVEQSRSMLRIVPFDTSDQEEEHDDFF